MEVADINPKSVAEAVGGTVDHSGCVICLCPIHETGGGHSPSLALSITDDRRILFTCRSQKCDRKHAREITRFLVEKGLPKSHVGGIRAAQTFPTWDYFSPEGVYSWTKQKIVSKAGKKSFICGVFDHSNNDWVVKSRPADAPLLLNLQTIAPVMGTASDIPLMIVEGEKDVVTATDLGVLATTNADGAGKWRVEDTKTLVGLGVKKAFICPDNDGVGFEHGVAVAKSLQGGGVEVRWLELPELGMKEDLSDWAPRQVDPEATLAELIAIAPIFDEETLGWRSRLKCAGRDAPYLYRGDKMNIELALKFEARLRGRFAWNAFRNRVEVVQRTPWCNPDWWSASNLTPRGYRPLRDTDITRLGNYLTESYDYGDCPLTACRAAINAVASDHEFDELKDWLHAMPEWDGVARLDDWLAGYCGAGIEAHTPEYLAMASSKYIMQVLNRALNPGAKADYALVLTSSQGSGKDKILESTFAPYYSESVPSPRQSQADFAMAISGSLVAHSAEMAAWKKSEVEDQKAVLTRNVDRGRPAYGYVVRDYPRRTSLAFSTNDIDFLRDATGDRRYWGVSIKREAVRLDELRRDRDQIFGEALHRLWAGEQHWPTPEEEDAVLNPNQRQSMPESAIELVYTLESYIVEKPRTPIPSKGSLDWIWDARPQPLREMRIDDFFEECFGMYAAVKRRNLDRASKKDVDYCATWLRKNGWRKVEALQKDGRKRVVWRSATGGPGGGSRHVDAKPGRTAESTDPASEKPQRADAATTAEADQALGVERGGSACERALGTGIRPKRTQSDPKKSLGRTVNQLTIQDNLTYRPSRPKVNNDVIREEKTPLSSEDVNFSVLTVVNKKLGRLGRLGRTDLQGATAHAAFDDLAGVFPRSRFLALDIETTGLSATADRVRTVQLSDGEHAAILIFDEPAPARALVILSDFLRERRIVVHNARFEGAWFRQAGLDVVLDDTALLFSAVRGTRLPDKQTGRHRDAKDGLISLADLAEMVLGETLDKSEQTSDWSARDLTEAQIAYALDDAIVTAWIYDTLAGEMRAKSDLHGVDIGSGYEDVRYSAAMARDMEHAGVGFDADAHAAWVRRKAEVAAAIDAHLLQIEPTLTPACINSHVQLDKLFRARLAAYAPSDLRRALFVWPKTESARHLSFGREALAEVLSADRLQPAERRLIEALYSRAEHSRGLATFGEGFAKHVVNGRLYGQLHPGGAVTGRYTSSDPNLQNIPTDPEFRGFFRAPEGRMLVDVDYGQLELRVYAATTCDTKMIATFEVGWDYHDLVAKKVGCTRRQAKAINFGIIYGKGVSSLAADLGVDPDTAGEYLRVWDEQAPVAAQWRSERPGLYAQERGVRTARRWIDHLDDDRSDVSANTRPVNFPIQGAAADVMHRAMRLLFERHRDWPGNVVPVLTIHDENLLEVDAEFAEAVGTLLAGLMVEALVDVLPNGPTRFLAIPGIGKTWAAAKEDGKAREDAARVALASTALT